MLDRRQFLTQSTVACVGAVGAGLGLWTRTLSASDLGARRAITTWFPDARDPAAMRRLAQAAVDAAMSAGAEYADIRVVDRRALMVSRESSLGYDWSYGIRVYKHGRWGFGYGVDPTIDGASTTAQRLMANLGTHGAATSSTQLAPAPAERGEWATPVEIDPFSLTPDDHVALREGVAAAVRHAFLYHGGRKGGPYGYDTAAPGLQFLWTGETRVFASSEGALTTQYLARAIPMFGAGGNQLQAADPTMYREGYGFEWSIGRIVGAASAGFEIAVGPKLQDQFVQLYEEALRWSTYPRWHHFPVGRYDVVFDGTLTSGILARTLLPALSLDRALGLEINSAGPSFLAPPESMLGTQVFSPLVTLSADRSLPHLGAAKWDDEGVPTQPFTLIKDGTVIDYFRGRRTTMELADRLHTTPRPVYGSSLTGTATRDVVGAASCVSMAPASHGPSLDELIKGMGSGIVARGRVSRFNPSMDPSGGNGMLNYYEPAACYEVKGGKIIRQLLSLGSTFTTKKFWHDVKAVGGEDTVQQYAAQTHVGLIPSTVMQQSYAPAVYVRGVDVLDLDLMQGA